MSALDALLGKAGEAPRCRVVSNDLAIHWFPRYEQGVPCFCGATTCDVEDDDQDDPASLAYDLTRQPTDHQTRP